MNLDSVNNISFYVNILYSLQIKVLTLLFIRLPVHGILKGKYHCTVDLLFDWLGISCMTTDNFFTSKTD